MPRPNPGPRLRLYGPDSKHGAKPRKGFQSYTWYIVWSDDGRKREQSTGACFEDRGAAEAALGDFLASRALQWSTARRPDQVLIAEVLAIYGEEHAPKTADPGRIAACIVALVGWWDDRRLSDVTPKAARDYVAARTAAGRSAATARKELGTLVAAQNYCHDNRKLSQVVPIKLPPKSPAKEIFFNRTEIALLLLAARRERKARGHLPHFILCGFYTGRRKRAILKLQWLPNTQAGHVDFPAGRIDFQGRRNAETKKRKGRAEIPRHLATFLRYLRKRNRQYVLEYRGTPLDNLKRSFATACETAAVMAEERAAQASSAAARDLWLMSAHRYRNASPHVLRHSCASWLVQQGIPFADIGQFIDMSVEMVERTYGHLAPDRNARVLRAMERR